MNVNREYSSEGGPGHPIKTHMAEHEKKRFLKSDPDRKSTTATNPSSGSKLRGLVPKVVHRFRSTKSLRTNRVSQ